MGSPKHDRWPPEPPRLRLGELVVWACGHAAPVPKKLDNMARSGLETWDCPDCCFYRAWAKQYHATGVRL